MAVRLSHLDSPPASPLSQGTRNAISRFAPPPALLTEPARHSIRGYPPPDVHSSVARPPIDEPSTMFGTPSHSASAFTSRLRLPASPQCRALLSSHQRPVGARHQHRLSRRGPPQTLPNTRQEQRLQLHGDRKDGQRPVWAASEDEAICSTRPPPSPAPAQWALLLCAAASAASLCFTVLPGATWAAETDSGMATCPLEAIRQLEQQGALSQGLLDSLTPKLCQQDSEAAKQLGDLLVDLGRPSQALGAYNMVADICGKEQPTSDDRTCAGALFGRAKAHELGSDWSLAVADYTASLQIQGDPIPYMNRAQALARLEEWAPAADDYKTAAGLYLQQRDRRMSWIAQAQGAFAQYEAGQVEEAKKALERIGRQLYSSDVRVALVAVYWEAGDLEKAESLWQQTCQIPDALCGRYTDREWLLSYRRWTPRLADGIADFLAMRVSPLKPN